MWEAEYTDEFESWYTALSEEDQDAIISRVTLLEQHGPGLGRPSVDNIHQSRHPNMKEPRAERSLRVLFAFDPRRSASCSSEVPKATPPAVHSGGTTGTTNTCRSPTTSMTNISPNSPRKD
jgi:hypothetical protein